MPKAKSTIGLWISMIGNFKMVGKQSQLRTAAILVVAMSHLIGNSLVHRAHAQELTRWGDAEALVKELMKIKSDPEKLKKLLAKRELQNPESCKSKNGKLNLDLTVKIDNFAHLVKNRHVRLRTYNGKLVGPTIRVQPGDTLRINLKNHPKFGPGDPSLDEDDDAELAPGKGHNYPNNFSATNLHTHGLSVSPVAPADNVFQKIEPGDSYPYCFKIPLDHPAGTFWYHPHRHGSTALQLCNGLAGALIVDPAPDDRKALEASPAVKSLMEKGREKILVFQEIRCSRDKNKPQVLLPSRRDVYSGGEQPPEREGFEVEQRFLINGAYLPIIVMKPMEVQRWRCIHAGIARRLKLVITKFPEGEELTKVLEENNRSNFEDFKLYCIAADGLALGKIEQQIQTDGPGQRKDEKARQLGLFSLLPGERSDFLVQLETEGIYYLRAESVDRDDNTRTEDSEMIPLALIYVPELLQRESYQELSKFAGALLPGRPPLQPALKTIKNKRLLQFRSKNSKFQVRWTFKDKFPDQDVAWHDFSENRTKQDLIVQAGSIEEWTLESASDNHPFHIHVNPFWVKDRVRTIKDKETGKTIEIGENIEQWRDTVLVGDGHKVTILIEFDKKFTGETVLHCHNLDHEDKGMMLRVVIGDTDGRDMPKAGFHKVPVKAPDWALPDCDKKKHQLADFAGSDILLVFVRGVSCSHCLVQLRALANRYQALRKSGLTVVVVSPDSSDDIKNAFARLAPTEQLPFLVLSDPDLGIFASYGCRLGGALHGTFLVDRLGIVRWQHAGEEPFLDMDRLLEQQGKIGKSTRR